MGHGKLILVCLDIFTFDGVPCSTDVDCLYQFRVKLEEEGCNCIYH